MIKFDFKFIFPLVIRKSVKMRKSIKNLMLFQAIYFNTDPACCPVQICVILLGFATIRINQSFHLSMTMRSLTDLPLLDLYDPIISFL